MMAESISDGVIFALCEDRIQYLLRGRLLTGSSTLNFSEIQNNNLVCKKIPQETPRIYGHNQDLGVKNPFLLFTWSLIDQRD